MWYLSCLFSERILSFFWIPSYFNIVPYFDIPKFFSSCKHGMWILQVCLDHLLGKNISSEKQIFKCSFLFLFSWMQRHKKRKNRKYVFCKCQPHSVKSNYLEQSWERFCDCTLAQWKQSHDTHCCHEYSIRMTSQLWYISHLWSISTWYPVSCFDCPHVNS